MYVYGGITPLFWVGGVTNAVGTTKFNYVFACAMSVFCRVAVNCFYMISGYFIHKSSKEISFAYIRNSVVRQYKKVWFYSVLIFFIAAIGHITVFSAKGLLTASLPIMSNIWWFPTVFILLTCLRPFIGKVLVELSDQELGLLLGCIGFFDSFQAVIGSNAFGERGTGILHAVFMLMIGYAIKRWNGFNLSKVRCFLFYFGSCFAAGILSIVEKRICGAEDAHAVFYNSPLIVVASAAFFILFLRINCDWKWSRILAPYVFAIYLINDHPIVREFAWEKILHSSSYYGSKWMIGHWLFSTISFMAIGISVDWLFIKLESLFRLRGGGKEV